MRLNVSATALSVVRSLGLEPGRAIANANPSPEVVAARRADQHAWIQAGLARPTDGVHRSVRPASRDRSSAFTAQRRHA